MDNNYRYLDQEVAQFAAYADTLKEAQIENLVTAKGYVDCVTFMGDTSVSVVVAIMCMMIP